MRSGFITAATRATSAGAAGSFGQQKRPAGEFDLLGPQKRQVAETEVRVRVGNTSMRLMPRDAQDEGRRDRVEKSKGHTMLASRRKSKTEEAQEPGDVVEELA